MRLVPERTYLPFSIDFISIVLMIDRSPTHLSSYDTTSSLLMNPTICFVCYYSCAPITWTYALCPVGKVVPSVEK